MFKNKLVLLGITGSVAAVKSVEVARLLMGGGATVKVVMTSGAQNFISGLTLEAVTGKPVPSSMFGPDRGPALEHIHLAREADAIIIAPATAEFMAKMAGGHGADLLSALTLAADCPKIVAPAMNHGMWRNAATVANVATLRDRGVVITGPVEGDLADFTSGEGRMIEPVDILEAAATALRGGGRLEGKTILITGGGTREYMDPVRFLANPSTGKMSVALAREAHGRGADVVFVGANLAVPLPAGIEFIQVTTAAEMHREVLARMPSSDALVMCAAITDYRFETSSQEKLKRSFEPLDVRLIPNADILADVAAGFPDKVAIGFAAETGDILAAGANKLRDKGVMAVIANKVGDDSVGFGADETEFAIVTRRETGTLRRTAKREAAVVIVDKLTELLPS